MQVVPEQIRAARALLRVGQSELARRAAVSVVTIRRLEAPDGLGRVTPATVDSVRRILENAGAEFIEDGVRRRATPGLGLGSRHDRLLAISLASAEALAGHELLTDDDLYNEDGLPT